ncbi:YrhB domain-containing protein [Desulfomicrobium escambiense]|uniref:YrhB domain-containing protein n=1 Tax=Desulfomicrobium escambiense TaxID=29503 RepID=UPI000A008AF4|nr:YrhB domain-containing protein [Desulfomicrobium escambiense]
MITYEVAREIAIREIASLNAEHDFVLLEEKTVEREFGWIFFYATHNYLKTMDPQFLVPGTAPIVVHKKDGSIEHLPTSLPPKAAIEHYEKEWMDCNKLPEKDDGFN